MRTLASPAMVARRIRDTLAIVGALAGTALAIFVVAVLFGAAARRSRRSSEPSAPVASPSLAPGPAPSAGGGGRRP